MNIKLGYLKLASEFAYKLSVVPWMKNHYDVRVISGNLILSKAVHG